MQQVRYHRVFVRPAREKPGLRDAFLRRAERLLEWLATYPPYAVGGEEAGLMFDQYRAEEIGSRDRASPDRRS